MSTLKRWLHDFFRWWNEPMVLFTITTTKTWNDDEGDSE
jgi:hypothetical protein